MHRCCALAFALSAFSAFAQIPAAEEHLRRALYRADLYNWAGAASDFAAAEQAFTAAGDQRNALYARLGRIRANIERDQRSLPVVSADLADEIDTNPLLQTDKQLRLFAFVVKGDIDTETDTASTRNEYTVIEPKQRKQDAEGEQPAPADPPCSKATSAIVVEGPGKRGEVVQVCAHPECEVHGKPDHRAEQEKAAREREREWKRQQEERAKHRETNHRLLDAVLNAVPKSLTRDDYEMLVVAAIDRLEYEAFDAACERYKIDTNEVHEPDAAAFELRKLAQGKTEAQLVRMLMELALLPSGFSDEPLPPHDPLASAAARYGVSLTVKKQTNAKTTKCAPTSGAKKPKSTTATKPKAATKKAVKKGGAA